jgi:hypothetical protein
MPAKGTTLLHHSSTGGAITISKKHTSAVAVSLEAQCLRYSETASASSRRSIATAANTQSRIQSQR